MPAFDQRHLQLNRESQRMDDVCFLLQLACRLAATGVPEPEKLHPAIDHIRAVAWAQARALCASANHDFGDGGVREEAGDAIDDNAKAVAE